MTRSAYRESVGSFEQALSALLHLPESRETREQGIDLRLALRSALLPSGDSGRILVYLREAEALAVALDDPRRLGHISGLSVSPFPQPRVRMTRLSPPLNARSRLQQPWGTSSYMPWRTSTWGQPTGPRGTIGRRSTVSGRPWRPSTVHSAVSVSVKPICLMCNPLPSSLRAMLSWARSPRAVSLGEEGLQIAETVAHPSSLMWAAYGIGLLLLCQGDLPRALPRLERAMGICQEADLPLFVPRIAAALGAAYTLAGTHRRRCGAAHAGDGTDDGNGYGRLSGAL